MIKLTDKYCIHAERSQYIDGVDSRSNRGMRRYGR